MVSSKQLASSPIKPRLRKKIKGNKGDHSLTHQLSEKMNGVNWCICVWGYTHYCVYTLLCSNLLNRGLRKQSLKIGVKFAWWSRVQYNDYLLENQFNTPHVIRRQTHKHTHTWCWYTRFQASFSWAVMCSLCLHNEAFEVTLWENSVSSPIF